MNNQPNIEHFPWLDERINPDIKPTYKIISRSQTLQGDSVVMLHKAGTQVLEKYFIRDLVSQKIIMDLLDPKEANLLHWIVNSENTDPLKS